MTETTQATINITDIISKTPTEDSTIPSSITTVNTTLLSSILPPTIIATTTPEAARSHPSLSTKSSPHPVPTIPPSSRTCPELNVPHSVVTSENRIPGSIVRIRCEDDDHVKEPTYLLCQNDGNWNSSMPLCIGSEHGIPLSTQLFIGVLTGCCGLVLLVVLAILLKMWFCSGGSKDRSRFSDRHHQLPRSSIDALPLAPNPIHYQTHDRRYNVYQRPVGKGGDTDSVKYAKPEIYSTFINPTFYEDVYDRWRRRESEDHYAEALYDSPWQHSKRPEEAEAAAGAEGADVRWSSVSLRAHDNYDYGRFGKIPRSQIGLPATPSEAPSNTPEDTEF